MKAVKKTFNEVKIGDTIYAYDCEFNYGFKLKVTRITEITNYNNDTYTWFECEKDFVIIMASKEKVKTSYKAKNLKMTYFVNEKDYNNKIY